MEAEKAMSEPMLAPRILQNLMQKVDSGAVTGFKTGTEVEAMGFPEIASLKAIADKCGIPLVVKVGGPEARNDMFNLHSLGVAHILAPMVESLYGLSNFIHSVKTVFGDSDVYRAVNIETITAYNAFDGMLGIMRDDIQQITVGRGDLSASLNLPVDHAEVFRLTRNIVAKAKNQNKVTSVGGKVTPLNATWIVEQVGPDYINTRHVMVKADADAAASIRFALEFEIELYNYLAAKFPEKADAYRNRMQQNIARLKAKPESVPAPEKKAEG